MGVLVICILYFEVFLNLTEGFLTLTEVFPCFFLSCRATARVKFAKTGHGPHSSTLVVICVVRLLFVLFYVLFVCKCHRVTTQLQLISISIYQLMDAKQLRAATRTDSISANANCHRRANEGLQRFILSRWKQINALHIPF